MARSISFTAKWVIGTVAHAAVTGGWVLWHAWATPPTIESFFAPRSPVPEVAGWLLLPFVGALDARLPDALLFALSSVAWGAIVAVTWTMILRRGRGVGPARSAAPA